MGVLTWLTSSFPSPTHALLTWISAAAVANILWREEGTRCLVVCCACGHVCSWFCNGPSFHEPLLASPETSCPHKWGPRAKLDGRGAVNVKLKWHTEKQISNLLVSFMDAGLLRLSKCKVSIYSSLKPALKEATWGSWSDLGLKLLFSS